MSGKSKVRAEANGYQLVEDRLASHVVYISVRRAHDGASIGYWHSAPYRGRMRDLDAAFKRLADSLCNAGRTTSRLTDAETRAFETMSRLLVRDAVRGTDYEINPEHKTEETNQ